MSFINAMKHYADFKGTTGRKEFWFFILQYYLLFMLVMILIYIPFFLFKNMAVLVLSSFLQMIFYFGTIIPFFAICWRRIHDTGHSGWVMFVPIYNLILFLSPSSSEPYPNKNHPNDKMLGIICLCLCCILPAFGGMIAAVAIPSYMKYIEQSKQIDDKLKQNEEQIMKQIEQIRQEEEQQYQKALNDAQSEE